MDIKHGRRKSFDIEYVIVTEENINEVATWCNGTVGGEGKDRFVKILDKGAINQMQTKAFLGDVVVRHVELNTFKKFGQKAFSKSYDQVEIVELSRSSVSGLFVSEEDAKAHPETTVTEHAEIPRDADIS